MLEEEMELVSGRKEGTVWSVCVCVCVCVCANVEHALASERGGLGWNRPVLF